MKEEKRDKKE